MTSDRPYRRAQSIEAAQAEIKRCSGTQFDPEVVEKFLAMNKGIWEVLRKQIDPQT